MVAQQLTNGILRMKFKPREYNVSIPMYNGRYYLNVREDVGGIGGWNAAVSTRPLTDREFESLLMYRYQRIPGILAVWARNLLVLVDDTISPDGLKSLRTAFLATYHVLDDWYYVHYNPPSQRAMLKTLLG